MKEGPQNFRETTLGRPVFNAHDVPSANYEANREQMNAGIELMRIGKISALFVGMFALGFIITANPRRKADTVEEVLLPPAVAANDDDMPYPRISSTEPLPSEPEEIIPPLPNSPHIILEIPSGDLHPEKMRVLINAALEELMKSGSMPSEEMRMEIRTDENISPEEMQELIHEALEPLAVPQKEFPTA